MRLGRVICGFSQKFSLALHSFWCYNECMSEKQTTTSITIRIPAEIAEALRRLAKQHDRSLNGEIVRALREYVKKHDEQEP
jgi:hypothetical protein